MIVLVNPYLSILIFQQGDTPAKDGSTVRYVGTVRLHIC